MFARMGSSSLQVLAVVCVMAATASRAQAQGRDGSETFYAGKTITFILGYPPGGANDAFARLAARFLGQQIPGSPRVVLQHMPGAGSTTAANYLFNAAPRDGTALALLVPTLPLEERMGVATVKYRSAEFSWIGRLASAPNITFMWHASKVKNIDDALSIESTLAATGSSATNAIYPSLLNAVVGAKFRMVMGYQGSGAAMLAMERGEIEGHSPTLDTLTTVHPDWLGQKKVNIVVQYLTARNRELPEVPTALEIATSDIQRSILKLAVSSGDIGKYVVSTPGLPAERLALLRDSFARMVRDPRFQEEARQQRLGLDPLAGDELSSLVRSVVAAPSDVADEVRKVYPRQ